MARKVFLSFLGTNAYKQCKYVSKEKGESKVVTFVQEAVMDLYCNSFTATDVAYIFLTKDAEKINWPGLLEATKNKLFKTKPISNISEGYSEADIWDIFERVFSILENDDEVILDVTHGFRSLPMLGIVLLNYAKSLKNITVKAILYGAFESLGPAHTIQDRIPNPENRKAPLLNLAAFSAIQSWTFGAESFILTGNTKVITQLSLENIKPILISTKGADEIASGIRRLMKLLSKIETTISTNRGKTINESNYVDQAKAEINNLTKEGDEIFAPIKPILGKILNKLNHFGKIPNWEAAVQWCIDHGLVQQGITQLQEGIISFICEQHQLEESNLLHRELVTQSLNIFDKEISESQWHKPALENKEIVHKIIGSGFVREHKNNYSCLSTYRNDINHGGYNVSSLNEGAMFKPRLAEIFNEFRRIKNNPHAPQPL